jgi:hypothetical protein
MAPAIRHLGCRAKEVTEQLWGEFCGCFEEPSLEKSPATVSHSTSSSAEVVTELYERQYHACASQLYHSWRQASHTFILRSIFAIDQVFRVLLVVESGICFLLSLVLFVFTFLASFYGTKRRYCRSSSFVYSD